MYGLNDKRDVIFTTYQDEVISLCPNCNNRVKNIGKCYQCGQLLNEFVPGVIKKKKVVKTYREENEGDDPYRPICSYYHFEIFRIFKNYVRSKNMTYSRIAEVVDVAQRTAYCWFNNDTRPRIRVIVNIMNYLEMEGVQLPDPKRY